MAHALQSIFPHATPRGFALKLDGNRIAAEVGAIALNAAVLLLLLAPMSASQMLSMPEEDNPIVVIEPIRPRENPEPVPVEEPRRVTQARETPAPAPKIDIPVIVPNATSIDIPTEAVAVIPEPFGTTTTATSIEPPLSGSHLEYITAPPPPYPRDAIRNGITGEVLLEVLVGVDGKPLQVTIKRSSGHRDLDQAARRQVLTRWTFKPAMREGAAVQALGLVPIEFALNQ